MGDETGMDNDENRLIVNEEDHDSSSSNDNDSPVDENVKLFGKDLKISRPQLYILCLLCPYFFLTSSYYSLFAPFFPVEALKKGITQTQVGIIFGIFQFAFLILAPIFGKYVIFNRFFYCHI